jgi:hypothetical protein
MLGVDDCGSAIVALAAVLCPALLCAFTETAKMLHCPAVVVSPEN